MAYMIRCKLVEVLLGSATTAQMRFQSHGETAASSLDTSDASPPVPLCILNLFGETVIAL
jgi:hypothetical protein